VGLCTWASLDENWDILCDDDMPEGHDRAQECPRFRPIQTKDEIKERAHEFFTNADITEISRLYPEVAALLWVLDMENPPREFSNENEEDKVYGQKDD